MKKRLTAIVAMMVMTMSLTACGNSNEADTASDAAVEQQESVTEVAETENAETEGGALVVYFSWSGNTENVAQEIQAQTGADIFEITPVEAYTTDYNEVLDVAQAEQANDARPEISGTIDNFDSYDVIYLGYPNWYADAPMIIYSFLDDYDLSGKTIAPFVTSGGSGFSNSLATIQAMEPDAAMTEGLSLGSSAASEPADEVAEWLAEIGMTE